ncbi:unnamed protein product [Alopecurus aequalis]
MIRLRSSIFAHLLSSPAASPVAPIHRLLSAAAAAHAASTNPSFAVEQYLVDTCGLTRAQALKASSKLSHLKSPTNPDAVLAFLADVGLSGADVAALVAKDPKFLCTGVDRTLGPNVVGLTGLGLLPFEIARLASLTPSNFRRRSSLEKTVKPNVTFLQECGLGACDIAKLCLSVRWLLGTKPERVRAMAARAEAIGVPRGSGMFRQALQAVALLSEEKIAVKVGYLKSTFMWSDAEVGIAVCKFPVMLKISNDILQSKSEFLISEVGLEPAYVVQRPALLGYSLQGRLRPRHYGVKFLKENGLQDRDRDYYYLVKLTEKEFLEKFICPHKEAAPHLAEDYEAACRGEVPTRFRFP